MIAKSHVKPHPQLSPPKDTETGTGPCVGPYSRRSRSQSSHHYLKLILILLVISAYFALIVSKHERGFKVVRGDVDCSEALMSETGEREKYGSVG